MFSDEITVEFDDRAATLAHAARFVKTPRRRFNLFSTQYHGPQTNLLAAHDIICRSRR